MACSGDFRVSGHNVTANEPDKRANLRQVGMYSLIPTVLLVTPTVAYFLGVLLARWLGAGDWLKVVMALLGFAAGIRETVRIVKRASEEN